MPALTMSVNAQLSNRTRWMNSDPSVNTFLMNKCHISHLSQRCAPLRSHLQDVSNGVDVLAARRVCVQAPQRQFAYVALSYIKIAFALHKENPHIFHSCTSH